ncbi:Hypothetical predicted protein [Xyrichtys novacula]|uniref:Secreted protein n=1 Tax=Xyrichtys novacula TaxID=13765 RepID=A0AAV1GLF7_XYRNO|nr:Hypothetical predicted protein [Xyrichtys novacula]
MLQVRLLCKHLNLVLPPLPLALIQCDSSRGAPLALRASRWCQRSRGEPLIGADFIRVRFRRRDHLDYKAASILTGTLIQSKEPPTTRLHSPLLSVYLPLSLSRSSRFTFSAGGVCSRAVPRCPWGRGAG